MSREISHQGLRDHCDEVVRAVEGGETVIVTRHGEPVAELVPFPRRRFVRREAVLEAFAGAPNVDLQSLRNDLDATADPDPTPRG